MRGERGWAHSTAPQSHFPVEVFPDDRHWGETQQRRTDQHRTKHREDRVRGKGGERPGACAVLEHVNLTPAQVSSQLAGRVPRLSCFHLLCSGSEGLAPKSFPAGPSEIRPSDSVGHETTTGVTGTWQTGTTTFWLHQVLIGFSLGGTNGNTVSWLGVRPPPATVLLLLIGCLFHVCCFSS